MAEATKSVLLIDYDSIHQSLSAGDSVAADRLASRLGAWIGAIETGSLFAAKPDTLQRRRILLRRCYADPARLGDNRAAFLSNGFQVVDCPPIEGRDHDTATIHVVLDCIDALDHPTEYEEFILLAADSDLSPLLIRLRAHNRTTAIYATMATADSYRAIADAVIEEPRFISALLSDEEPPDDEEDREEARLPADRTEIEALARKVSSATNVPLFAPRTFADLFRHLVEEIAENGYHFQTTAENVATRMTKSGRNVSRRQVVFVVKGLALKGHVFSTGDTPDRLADVFREQVLYLAENAGLTLDDNERGVLSSWIVGNHPSVQAGTAPEVKAQKPSPRSASTEEGQSRKAAKTESSGTFPRKPSKPASPDKPSGEAKAESLPKSATTSAATSIEKSKSAATRRPEAAGLKPSTAPTASQSAAGAGGSAREKSAATPGAANGTEQPTNKRPAPPASKSGSPTPGSVKSPPVAGAGDNDDKDAVESSILAAIAEAVDVLVEDGGNKPKPVVETNETEPSMAEGQAPAAATESEAEVEDIGDGDDIGDEIQRIIASYSRTRDRQGQ